MFNTDLPARADLPSSTQLVRSTLIALFSAAVILVTIVLPSEYAIDPTGIGRALGLADMGAIKTQLAAESAADAAAADSPVTPAVPAAKPHGSALSAGGHDHGDGHAHRDAGQVHPDTHAAPVERSVTPAQPVARQKPSAGRSDVVRLVLAPTQGAEVKMTMKEGARANFEWTTRGGGVNFDAHGDGGSRSVSYKKGRNAASDSGVIEAAFDGSHGWFWRNRGGQDVVVTLQTQGEYAEIKRVD